MSAILTALRLFYNIITILILVRCIGSFFVRNPYQSRWYMIIIQITEPILAPFRRLLMRFQRNMMVDFSPVLALLALSVAYKVIIRIILMIMS